MGIMLPGLEFIAVAALNSEADYSFLAARQILPAQLRITAISPVEITVIH